MLCPSPKKGNRYLSPNISLKTIITCKHPKTRGGSHLFAQISHSSRKQPKVFSQANAAFDDRVSKKGRQARHRDQEHARNGSCDRIRSLLQRQRVQGRNRSENYRKNTANYSWSEILRKKTNFRLPSRTRKKPWTSQSLYSMSSATGSATKPWSRSGGGRQIPKRRPSSRA